MISSVCLRWSVAPNTTCVSMIFNQDASCHASGHRYGFDMSNCGKLKRLKKKLHPFPRCKISPGLNHKGLKGSGWVQTFRKSHWCGLPRLLTDVVPSPDHTLPSVVLDERSQAGAAVGRARLAKMTSFTGTVQAAGALAHCWDTNTHTHTQIQVGKPFRRQSE